MSKDKFLVKPGLSFTSRDLRARLKMNQEIPGAQGIYSDTEIDISRMDTAQRLRAGLDAEREFHAAKTRAHSITSKQQANATQTQSQEQGA